jgi:hypothetical protein
MAYLDSKSQLPAHTPGVPKGEEVVWLHGREPGRDNAKRIRTARDATSINPSAQEPIDPAMPHLPPA